MFQPFHPANPANYIFLAREGKIYDLLSFEFHETERTFLSLYNSFATRQEIRMVPNLSWETSILSHMYTLQIEDNLSGWEGVYTGNLCTMTASKHLCDKLSLNFKS